MTSRSSETLDCIPTSPIRLRSKCVLRSASSRDLGKAFEDSQQKPLTSTSDSVRPKSKSILRSASSVDLGKAFEDSPQKSLPCTPGSIRRISKGILRSASSLDLGKAFEDSLQNALPCTPSGSIRPKSKRRLRSASSMDLGKAFEDSPQKSLPCTPGSIRRISKGILRSASSMDLGEAFDDSPQKPLTCTPSGSLRHKSKSRLRSPSSLDLGRTVEDSLQKALACIPSGTIRSKSKGNYRSESSLNLTSDQDKTDEDSPKKAAKSRSLIRQSPIRRRKGGSTCSSSRSMHNLSTKVREEEEQSCSTSQSLYEICVQENAEEAAPCLVAPPPPNIGDVEPHTEEESWCTTLDMPEDGLQTPTQEDFLSLPDQSFVHVSLSSSDPVVSELSSVGAATLERKGQALKRRAAIRRTALHRVRSKSQSQADLSELVHGNFRPKSNTNHLFPSPRLDAWKLRAQYAAEAPLTSASSNSWKSNAFSWHADSRLDACPKLSGLSEENVNDVGGQEDFDESELSPPSMRFDFATPPQQSLLDRDVYDGQRVRRRSMTYGSRVPIRSLGAASSVDETSSEDEVESISLANTHTEADSSPEPHKYIVCSLVYSTALLALNSAAIDLADTIPGMKRTPSYESLGSSLGSGDWRCCSSWDSATGSLTRTHTSMPAISATSADMAVCSASATDTCSTHVTSSSSSLTGVHRGSGGGAAAWANTAKQLVHQSSDTSDWICEESENHTPTMPAESHKDKKRRHLMNTLAKRLRANSMSVSDIFTAARDTPKSPSASRSNDAVCTRRATDMRVYRSILQDPTLHAMLTKRESQTSTIGSSSSSSDLDKVISKLNSGAKRANKAQSGMFGSKSGVTMLPVLQFSVQHLAEELALIDGELLRHIRINELEDCVWMKKNKEERAPNIVNMVNAFNRIALAVTTDILAQSTPQGRAAVIFFFIKVAMVCRSLNNFNSLKAILGGLQCTAIYRLSQTWKEVSSKGRRQFKKLTDLMSEEENFTCYRQELESALEAKSPCIPFLGVFLSKVVQIDAYQSGRASAFKPRVRRCSEDTLVGVDSATMSNSKLKVSKVDSTKSVSESGVIQSELWNYQLCSLYHLSSRSSVRNYLLHMPYSSEAESYKRSEEYEPPNKKLQ